MKRMMVLAALAALPRVAAAQATVSVRLSEWRVQLGAASVPAGRVTFQVTNAGTIPHAFEVEGRGVEKETAQIQAGHSDSLTLTLRPGRYEAYCPVGGDSHKKLGMLTHFTVTNGPAAAATMTMDAPVSTAPRTIAVTGGGPVIQILPGPFPFADSAAAVIQSRPDDQRRDLLAKAQHGPYSDSVARIAGTIALRAWDFGPTRDSVEGSADLTTRDGAQWRLVLDSVQTRDIPDNPRFGGVILGLYYHGATGVHTPLVPTIKSAVALWAWAHLWRAGQLVTDRAMVHVMLLSQTRRDGSYALECWDCSRNPIRELQLQVTPAPGQPAFDAPGGVLFVNWERATKRGG